MSEKKSTLRVVLNKGGLIPKVGDRVEIEEGLTWIEDPQQENLILRFLSQSPGERGHKVALHQGSNLEDGTLHFTGQSDGGYRFDVTLHTNYRGQQFVYGHTGYVGKRGGTAIWVAEDQEAGRPGPDKKPKGK